MNVRSRVLSVFSRFGYDIVHHRPHIEQDFDLLGFLVSQQLVTDRQFFFIQVGANDGLRCDPLRPLVLHYHLAGLLIEPLPDMFGKLKCHYAAESQLLFDNCAVDETEGSRDFYRVRAGAPVPDWAHGLGSFNRRNLSSTRQGIPGLEAFVERVVVPTKTMDSLCREHGITRTSLLLVDTEGFDAHVVRSALAAGLRPTVVVYEHVHLDAPTHVACAQLLKDRRYRLLETEMDMYAIAEEFSV